MNEDADHGLIARGLRNASAEAQRIIEGLQDTPAPALTSALKGGEEMALAPLRDLSQRLDSYAEVFESGRSPTFAEREHMVEDLRRVIDLLQTEIDGILDKYGAKSRVLNDDYVRAMGTNERRTHVALTIRMLGGTVQQDTNE